MSQKKTQKDGTVEEKAQGKNEKDSTQKTEEKALRETTKETGKDEEK